MSQKFPHLINNHSDFPDFENVNVYKYDNDVDYSRFDYTQMKVTLCRVPWDMGEAHIGARTISGIGNVVYFESEKKRDKYFDDLPDSECFRFETKYRNLHRTNGSQGEIKVPVPFDIACKYNYVAIEYSLVANNESPLEYESDNGKRNWFWFVREVEMVAPNTTVLHLMLDAWQTYIYDVHIGGMILERGHAPLVEVNAETYLKNPIANCANLLAEDVNFGEADVTTYTASHVINTGNMYACFITDANAYSGSWGTKAANSWRTPARRHFTTQGTLTELVFAIPAANLTSFLNAIDTNIPQFKQCIKGIFFASDGLITLSTEFTFNGYTCHIVTASYKRTTIHTLSKSDFAYPPKYADLAKLYTWPYSYIRMTDENGDGYDVRIENTKGFLEFEESANLVFPWLNVSGQLTNVGKGSRKNISFSNVSARNMPIGGNWHETIMQWDIPILGAYQDAGLEYDYSSHFDRAQQQLAANNSYNSSVTSAAAAHTNSNNDAANIVAVGTLQNTLNTSLTANGNTLLNADSLEEQALSSAMTVSSSVFTTNTTNDQIDYQYASGMIGAASSAANGALSGGTTLAAGGPYGIAIGAIGGGAIGAVSAILGTNAGVNLTEAQATETQHQMGRNNIATQTNIANKTTNAVTRANADRNAHNTFTTASAAQNAGTVRTNATNTENAADNAAANALNTATNAIANQVKQAALRAPIDYGSPANGDNMASRPMAVFSNVITQNDCAISRAGDEFLRYGYMYGKQWAFNGNWNAAPHFTYWKLQDFWVRDLQVPDMYMDMIRFFLFGGVTVWKDPDEIGKISIYDNLD